MPNPHNPAQGSAGHGARRSGTSGKRSCTKGRPRRRGESALGTDALALREARAFAAAVPGLQRAQDQGEADLQRIVEAARVEAGQCGDLVEAIAERVAM